MGGAKNKLILRKEVVPPSQEFNYLPLLQVVINNSSLDLHVIDT